VTVYPGRATFDLTRKLPSNTPVHTHALLKALESWDRADVMHAFDLAIRRMDLRSIRDVIDLACSAILNLDPDNPRHFDASSEVAVQLRRWLQTFEKSL
jgi:hypothetical protein